MSENRLDNRRASENKSKISRKKLAVVIAVVAVLAILTAYVGYAGSYSGVYPNTYIDGTKVSGLTYDGVLAVIEKNSGNAKIPETLEFSIGSETLTVDSAEISLKSDTEKTARAALGNREEKGFFSRVWDYTGSLFKTTELKTDVSYNEEKLNQIISNFAAPYEEEPVDASYEVNDDKLTIHKGHQGKKVDKKALNEGIKEYVKNPNSAIALKITAAGAKNFDAEELYNELSGDAKDAYYIRRDDGSIAVVPDKPQVKVSKSALEKALKSDDDAVTITVSKSIPAKKTAEHLEKALFSGVMGSWTSHFSASNRPRTTNVSLSAERINGVILLPGETFSYDKTVGPRTAQNGFKQATVYINNKQEQGIGGGICQTSSTLYSAVLYANLEIVERTSHSLPVSYMPAGQDATIAEGSIDFKFKNNTDYPVKIVATLNGGSITCQIVGTPVEGQKVVINNTTTAVYQPKVEVETDPAVPKGYKKTVLGSSGKAVASTRTVYQDNKVVKTEKLTGSKYNASPTVVTVNPEDKDIPPEALTEYSESEQTAPPESTEQETQKPELETPQTPQEPDEEEIIEI